MDLFYNRTYFEGFGTGLTANEHTFRANHTVVILHKHA